ncbi:adenylosuccinate lyase [candidate division MSBL1 archaeon SCGC-AAA833F18]|uniref:Adenylosuccinate lyase n=2 Tax=candidate division MSBL1 TaxID=215777 RepID=A0A133VSZ3_9EURY|nr:adenylosuccinate lyase [candidate division MSBL1 archaeon SCGC-AAA261O19]KXB09531.1 adenylosuccinate lyase [candidate division MSBL1 archaeon SCGC-AAA833F18]
MPVHPIENRYGSDEMRAVFEEETRFQRMLDVEGALAKALAAEEMIPKTHGQKIARKAKIKHVPVKKIRKLEEKTGHETMALVLALAEVSGTGSRSVHFGATSNDILDTAMALQFRDALEVLEKRMRDLLEVMIKQAKENVDTVIVGRTHGQHAVPTTLGMKFAIWASEMGRNLKRLEEVKSRVLVGQMTGAVGTGAAWGEKASKIQKRVMEELELESVEISNQVIQRDRFAELISFLGLLGGTLAKVGREIRNLQRTEISEVSEPFGEEQVGSSTMPHKRNPIKSERVCGLARVLRANVQAGLENMVIEHERDLTNSSCERVLLPESFLIIDQMFLDQEEVLENLRIRAKRMEQNLKLTQGLNMAEAVMIEVTRRGMDRQKAHKALRECTSYALREGVSLSSALQQNGEILEHISKEEIRDLLNPKKYLGNAENTVKKVIKNLEKIQEE